ncbi:FtsX-like permease family protein [Polymorphospora rubra]|uniref:Membrane protein n=1 Tax=Polymorphospora rubra TaxID=338584 RepID=A0A810N0E8_9ACTN|nr:ABC transporter permease [Polymorphospora rubra]BCJ66866.1 membrane protein [Polymorphospora rubra]
MRSWARDLALGCRLAISGGREGWTRTVLTAVGVGLGVALLLLSAAVPNILDARSERTSARADLRFTEQPLVKGDDTLLVLDVGTRYRGEHIYGRMLRAEGVNAPRPPGVAELPGPGEMLVSPSLERLLTGPDGALLRERLDARIVGTIGDEGLAGAREHAFYVGSDSITEDRAQRIDGFGVVDDSEGLDPVLLMLTVVIFAVLLLPVAVFIGAAVRFGGDRRDRRLAALRLVGADGAMIRRIAAGEALLGSVLGLGVGAVVFFAGRQLVELFTVMDVTVFAGDVRPTLALTLLVVLAVPAAAVAVTLFALRRVVIEPLGVVRHATGGRRRLWWRLLFPALGLALLAPLVGTIGAESGGGNEMQVAAGAVLLLIGVAVLLPWLVEAVVGRLPGGGVPWQLATRRLQLSSGTSARVVSGIAVASAGAIALQMLFAGVSADYVEATGEDPGRAQFQVWGFSLGDHSQTEAAVRRFRETPGIRDVTGYSVVYAGSLAGPAQGGRQGGVEVLVGDCATLAEFAVLDGCAAGDAFLSEASNPDPESTPPGPGDPVVMSGPAATEWTIPATTRMIAPRADSPLHDAARLYVTPEVLPSDLLRGGRVEFFVNLDAAEPDAVEHLRTAVVKVSPYFMISERVALREDDRFAGIRRGLFIGALLTMLLIGASMLVTTLEQLRERRRLLAVLVAFGTRRSTLTWSVLLQTAVPVVLGLALAIGVGLGLGAVLMSMVDLSVRVDWTSIGQITGVAAGVVLLVTALSLPVLWRLMRPDGLRTE